MGTPSSLHPFRNPDRRRAGALVRTVSVLLALAVVSAAQAAGPWSGSGSRSTSVGNNGTSDSPASFSCSVPPGNSGNWRFSTTAADDGSVVLSYSYGRYHAFFQVRVGLTAFVTHGAVTASPPSSVPAPSTAAQPRREASPTRARSPCRYRRTTPTGST